MNKLRITLSALLMSLAVLPALSWGQKGHDVTAAVAEANLNPAAKAAVDSLLEGRSMVYWANWLDNASHQPEMAYTKTWHYKNIDEDTSYEEAPANPAGDITTAIKAQVETLSDPSTTFDQKQLSLKILIHLLGDLHQPMHMGHATDLGGNRTKVRFFGSQKNLHGIWDTNVVESAHKWSFSEWRDQLNRLSPEQRSFVQAGSIDDWAKETLLYATKVYAETPEGSNLSYNEVAYWTPVIEQQLLYGGLRLAYLLNQIFTL